MLTGTITYSATTPNVVGPVCYHAKMTDSVTPDFHAQIASGRIIMNSLESFKSDLTATSSTKSYDLKRYTHPGNVLNTHVYGWADAPWSAHKNVPRVAIPLMSPTSQATELALFGDPKVNGPALITEAVAKATGPDALGLVTLAEFDKTLDLFHQVARVSTKSVLFLERQDRSALPLLKRVLAAARHRGYLRPGGFKRLVRDFGIGIATIASTWLGYRYGVMATLYDVESWMSAFAKRNRYRFTVSLKSESLTDSGWVFQNTNVWRDYYRRTSRKRTTITTAGVLIDTRSLTMSDRLGGNHLATSAWELVPYSFVLDWFVEVGTWIQAIEGNLRCQPLGSWLTYDSTLLFFDSYDYRYDRNGLIADGYKHYSSGSNTGSVTELCRYKSRVANPRLPPLPQINVKLNGRRIADAVALIAVNARRIRDLAGS
jgi:hypothetical protein